MEKYPLNLFERQAISFVLKKEVYMHKIQQIISNYKNGIHDGIVSVCCSNKFVIEAAMDKLRDKDIALLVEATANQVDQFGGYTGMKPIDYVNYIYNIADKIGFPRERIILGGDHLEPLTWTGIDADKAMENAKVLIEEYVLAGFTKIHIDTSMPLLGDIEKNVFGDEIIAERAGYVL